MASMSTTSNPLGRWWHPLPLMSGVGALIGMVIMKLTGMIEFSWWIVILFPLIADLLINGAIVGVCAIGCRIADIIEKKQRKRK